mmetsp:Transcript_21782/g.61182  ORF Transcript_21782/g.61182 Transcript_21782/m.61182 type:complete len:282 (-) Transcript_21782:430-1275(-)
MPADRSAGGLERRAQRSGGARGVLRVRHAHGPEPAADACEVAPVQERGRQVHGHEEPPGHVQGPGDHADGVRRRQEAPEQLGVRQAVVPRQDGHVLRRPLPHGAPRPRELPERREVQAREPGAPEQVRVLRGPDDGGRHTQRPNTREPGVVAAAGRRARVVRVPRAGDERFRRLPVLPAMAREVQHAVEDATAVHGAPGAPAARHHGRLQEPPDVRLHRPPLQARDGPAHERGDQRHSRCPRRVRSPEGAPHGAPHGAEAAPRGGGPLQDRRLEGQGGPDA